MRSDQRSDRRPREGGDEEEDVAAGRREPRQVRAHELAETAGNRRGRPGAGGASDSSRPISSAKNGLPPVISHSCVSCGGESSSPRRCLRIWNSTAGASGPTDSRSTMSDASPRSSSRAVPANGEKRADALVREPAEREEERPGGRPIEPLEVVDCDDDRSVGRERLEDVEHRQPDLRAAPRRPHVRTLDQQRRFERAAAERVERRQHVGRHRAQQLADPGEGEDGLGLDRTVREHARSRAPARAASPACQSAVLPMPASPESTSTDGAAAARSRKSSSDRISLSRPLSPLSAIIRRHSPAGAGQSTGVSSFPAADAGVRSLS